jgi:hypothetical protein
MRQGNNWNDMVLCFGMLVLKKFIRTHYIELRAKEKLTEKIMWFIGNLPSTIQHATPVCTLNSQY